METNCDSAVRLLVVKLNHSLFTHFYKLSPSIDIVFSSRKVAFLSFGDFFHISCKEEGKTLMTVPNKGKTA